jgi:hypothetical protein
MAVSQLKHSEPSLHDFHAKVELYRELERKVLQIPAVCDIGCLNLQTEALKNSLKSEVSTWQTMYARALIDMSLHKVSKVTDYMTFIEAQLNAPIDTIDIDKLRLLLGHMQEFFDSDANFEIEIQPLSDGLHMLEQSECLICHDDANVFSVQSNRWNALQSRARMFCDSLLKHRPYLLRKVQEDAQKLSFEVMQAKARMESNGPYVKSNEDVHATVERMLQFTNDLSHLLQRVQACNDDEKLLQIPCTQFSNISSMMVLMQQGQPVYQLYMKAKALELKAREIPVSKLSFGVPNIISAYKSIIQEETSVDSLVHSMPVWSAYKRMLSPWACAVPVLDSLMSPVLRARHWILIMRTIKSMLPHPAPKVPPFGLEQSSADASAEAVEVFLSTIDNHSIEISAASSLSLEAMTSDNRAKMLMLTTNALSKISAFSLMCLICCIPVAGAGSLCSFRELAENEVQVEQGIDRIEGYLVDATLALSPIPKFLSLANDSDDGKIVSVPKLQHIIDGIQDCRMQLLMLKQHPYAGVFLTSIQELFEVVSSTESCLELLYHVQETWLRSRSFISVIESQSSATMQPTEVRIVVDNQRLMSRIMAQIQTNPNVVELCSPSSVLPRTLPIVLQNLEALNTAFSSMLLEYRLRFPELFALNDDEAAEILSMGCKSLGLSELNQTKFYRTFNLFPSIRGLVVNITSAAAGTSGSTEISMNAVQMVSDCGERYRLIENGSVCFNAIDTLKASASAAKYCITASHSSALQQLLDRAAQKLDRNCTYSEQFIMDLVRAMPLQPLLLALWTIVTELIDSALENISSSASNVASCDEVFLETARFLGNCFRETTKSIQNLEDSNKRSLLETVLTCIIEQDEVVQLLRDKVSNGSCTGSRDFDWFCHFRYYNRSSQGSAAANLMVEVGGLSRAYSCQPVSGAQAVALPLISGSSRVAVAVIAAVSGYVVPVLVGPAGSGKRTVVRSVAARLGQSCLMLDAGCDEITCVRWVHAIAGAGHWGIVSNCYQLFDDCKSSDAQPVRHLGLQMERSINLASRIAHVIRTLAESRRNGKVTGMITVQGGPLLVLASAAFIFCGRSVSLRPMNPISQLLRNMTRTVQVATPSAELMFTIALRVNVGLSGSRSRALASQLHLLARSSAAFAADDERFPHFSPKLFFRCVIDAAKTAKEENAFLIQLLLNVQKRANSASFSIYMDAHKCVFGGDSALPPALDSFALAASSEHRASERDDNLELIKVVRGLGLIPTQRFCSNVLNLANELEICRSIMVVGSQGSGRSSTIMSALGYLKSRSLRTNVHVSIIPEASTRAQLFGVHGGDGGVWLKGMFQHFMSCRHNSFLDNQLQNLSQIEGCETTFESSRICMEIDCNLDGLLIDLLMPAIKGEPLSLDNNSSISMFPHALFILKGTSLGKCSPALPNVVNIVYCSAKNVEILDLFRCSIGRTCHPLKENVMKVVTALLVPCIASPPRSVVNESEYRHHVVSFFNAMMSHLLVSDDGVLDSHKNDASEVIGSTTTADFERFTAFTCLWAAGAELTLDARVELCSCMRSRDVSGWFPSDLAPNKSYFDYFPVCDNGTGVQWAEWSSAVPAGAALHNIMSHTSYNFSRQNLFSYRCQPRVYVPTTQSIAATFLLDLLSPRSGVKRLMLGLRACC